MSACHMSNTYVDPWDMLNNCLILTLSHSFTFSFTHSWHAEQLLFSCLCSEVTLSLFQSHTLSPFHSLIHSLSICWTTFVFMSMLKSNSLTLSLRRLEFDYAGIYWYLTYMVALLDNTRKLDFQHCQIKCFSMLRDVVPLGTISHRGIVNTQ